MKQFLIAACPRSGTNYIADLLTELGVPCKWENKFSLMNSVIVTNKHPQWIENGIGESSWLSVPYLEEIPKDVLILHQVRYPKYVIRSMFPHNIHAGIVGEIFKKFIDKRINGTVESYAGIWISMNEKIEKYASYRYRIEDIDTEIFNILKLIDVEVDNDVIKNGLSKISRKTNSKSYNMNVDITPHKNVIQLAKRYGYSSTPPEI